MGIFKKPFALFAAFLGTVLMFAVLILTLNYLRTLWNKTDRGEINPVFELPEKEKGQNGKGPSKGR